MWNKDQACELGFGSQDASLGSALFWLCGLGTLPGPSVLPPFCLYMVLLAQVHSYTGTFRMIIHRHKALENVFPTIFINNISNACSL